MPEEMNRSERLMVMGYEAPDESDWETGLHPMDELLRGERLPHIWCQGCGLGTAMTSFVSALQWLEKNEDLGPGQGFGRLGNWLHGTCCRIYTPGFLPHHAWPGNSLCFGT